MKIILGGNKNNKENHIFCKRCHMCITCNDCYCTVGLDAKVKEWKDRIGYFKAGIFYGPRLKNFRYMWE